MAFVTETTNFGNKDNIFGKVFTKALTDGTNEIDVADLSKGVKEWKAETAYKKDMLTYVNEKLYICIVDHTSGTDFATDLLAGDWKFIGNGVGSNVTQTELWSGVSSKMSNGGSYSLTLSDDVSNYDYLIVDTENGNGYQWNNIVDLAKSSSFETAYTTSSASNWTFSYTASISGTTLSYKSLTIYPSSWENAWYISKVTGIKITELTTNYLAELSMPSDVYETISWSPTVKTTSWQSISYTPKANGYLCLKASSYVNSSFDSCITINGKKNSDVYIGSYVIAPRTANRDIYCTLPVYVGNTYDAYVMNILTFGSLNFVYSVGSAKALGLI